MNPLDRKPAYDPVPVNPEARDKSLFEKGLSAARSFALLFGEFDYSVLPLDSVMTINGQKCTHHINNVIFGTEKSVQAVYESFEVVGKHSAEFYDFIKDQIKGGRCAVIAMEERNKLAVTGSLGLWEPFVDPCLKSKGLNGFETCINIDVTRTIASEGKRTLAGLSAHEWKHEFNSIRRGQLKKEMLVALPDICKTDGEILTLCNSWCEAFETFNTSKQSLSPAEIAAGEQIFKQPSLSTVKYFNARNARLEAERNLKLLLDSCDDRLFCQMEIARFKRSEAEALEVFCCEVSTNLLEAKVNHEHKVFKKVSGKLPETVDAMIGEKIFMESRLAVNFKCFSRAALKAAHKFLPPICLVVETVVALDEEKDVMKAIVRGGVNSSVGCFTGLFELAGTAGNIAQDSCEFIAQECCDNAISVIGKLGLSHNEEVKDVLRTTVGGVVNYTLGTKDFELLANVGNIAQQSRESIGDKAIFIMEKLGSSAYEGAVNSHLDEIAAAKGDPDVEDYDTATAVRTFGLAQQGIAAVSSYFTLSSLEGAETPFLEPAVLLEERIVQIKNASPELPTEEKGSTASQNTVVVEEDELYDETANPDREFDTIIDTLQRDLLQFADNPEEISQEVIQKLMEFESSIISLDNNEGANIDPLDLDKKKEGSDKKKEKKEDVDHMANVMKCAAAVAAAITDNMNQKRAEKASKFEFKETVSDFNRAKNKRQHWIPSSRTDYSGPEHFHLTHTQPPVNQFDRQLWEGDYTKAVKNLCEKLKENLARQDSLQKLSRDIDRNTDRYLWSLQRKREKKLETARAFRTLNTVLTVAKSVLKGSEDIIGVALHASHIGQANLHAGIDHIDRKMRKRLNDASDTQRTLETSMQSNQFAINQDTGQLNGLLNIPLSSRRNYSVEGYSKALESAKKIRDGKIAELTERKNALDKPYKDAGNAASRAQSGYDQRRNKLVEDHGENSRKERKDDKLNGYKQDYNEAKVEEDRLKGAINDIDEDIKDLEKLNTITQAELADNEFLKPMNLPAEKAINRELLRFDFDRIKEGDNAGQLSDLGKAQRDFAFNRAAYNESRNAVRNLAGGCLQALQGLSGELYHITGSSVPYEVVDLAKQFFNMYDQMHTILNFSDRLVDFMKLNNIETVLDGLSKVGTLEVIVGCVIPGIGAVSAALSALRIVHSLISKSDHEQKTELQHTLNQIETFFKQHQKYLRYEMERLKGHIDERFNKVDHELDQLHSELVETSKTLESEIRSSREETKADFNLDRWKNYEESTDRFKLKLKTDNDTFLNNIEIQKNQERKIEEKLIKLKGEASKFNASVRNGLTHAKEGDDIIIDLELISTHPEYFAGLLESNAPNPVLYNALREVYSDFIAFLEANEKLDTPKVRNRLAALGETLKAQSCYLRNLLDQTPRFIERAKEDKQVIEDFIVDSMASQKKRCSNTQKAYIQAQFTPPFQNIQRLRSRFVGKAKNYLPKLINGTPLHETREALDLHKLYQLSNLVGIEECSKREYHEYKEEQITAKMQSALKDFAPRDKLPKWGIYRHVIFPKARKSLSCEVTYKYALSNKEGAIQLVDFIFQNSKWYGIKPRSESLIHSWGPSYEIDRNEKSLLKFDVKYIMASDEYVTTFNPDSLIQAGDIKRIKKIKEAVPFMSLLEERLVDCYEDLLHTEVNNAPSKINGNPFFKKEDGALIASLDGSLLPLLLPNKLLKEIERILFKDVLDMTITETGLLLPFVDFKFETTLDAYALTLHYRCKAGLEELQDYCFFTLATFDKAAVESFKRIDFMPGQASEKYTYKIGAAHLQEFLLQAMYANDKVALPGQCTTRSESGDLYIPDPQRFKGLFAIWMSQDRPITLSYNSSLYKEGDYSSLLGPKLQPKYGKNYLSLWRKFRSQEHLTGGLKGALSSYEKSYHLCKAIYSLKNGLDPATCKINLEQEGLFDPKNLETLYFDIQTKKTPATQEEQKPQSVQSSTTVKSTIPQQAKSSTPSAVKHAGLPNVNMSCWLSSMLQWFHHFPRFKVGVLDELTHAKKDTIVRGINETLINYGKEDDCGLAIGNSLRALLTAIFDTTGILMGKPGDHMDPIDILDDRMPPAEIRYKRAEWRKGVILRDKSLSCFPVTISPECKSLQSSASRDFADLLKFAFRDKLSGSVIRKENEGDFCKSSSITFPDYVVLDINNVTHEIIEFPQDGKITLGADRFTIVGAMEHIRGRIEHFVSYTNNDGNWTLFNDDIITENQQLIDFGSRCVAFLLEKDVPAAGPTTETSA